MHLPRRRDVQSGCQRHHWRSRCNLYARCRASTLMAVSIPADARLLALEDVATQLRVDSVRATTAAGSGHPTSCASAADLVAAIFFDVMRFDPQAPRDPACDRFVLSKGHAAPLLYAAWAAVGALDR